MSFPSPPPTYETNPDTRTLPTGWLSQYDPTYVVYPIWIPPRSTEIELLGTKLGPYLCRVLSGHPADKLGL